MKDDLQNCSKEHVRKPCTVLEGRNDEWINIWMEGKTGLMIA